MSQTDRTPDRECRTYRAWLLATVVVGTLALQTASFSAWNQPLSADRVSRFTKGDRSALAAAAAGGLKTVALVIAAQPGKNEELAQGLRSIGATIRYRDDSVDYLSAITALERADEIARWPTMAAVNVDVINTSALEHAALEHARIRAQHHLRAGYAPDQDHPSVVRPPGRDTPRENPYLPTRDIGAPQFVAKHPTFDGRGVTIGVVDIGVDVASPELQTAIGADGRVTRKIVDWLITSGPPARAEEQGPSTVGDCRWVDMQATSSAKDLRLIHGGLAYVAPRDGPYRIGVFDERRPGCDYVQNWLLGDVNRDGNPPKSSGLFAVLWDDLTNQVWVDTNQNQDFSDQKPMTDYASRFDVDVFGKDNPSTPIREEVSFVVQTDRARHWVALGITNGGHGTMVAGTAAGSGFFNAFDGVAPGAQIVSIRFPDFYVHSIIEALIAAAVHPRVDVVQVAVGATVALDDGSLVLDMIVDRLIESYKKPFFVGAGNNGPATNSLLSPSVASKAFSVGAYISNASWLANFGARVPEREYITGFSARGPTEDGRLKPDFVAPSGALAPETAVSEGFTWTNIYSLPPGYRIGSGTSQASPFASGAAALLISAARQMGIPYDVARLRAAFASGARFLSRYGSHEQGSGLLNVDGAWQALLTMRDRAPVKIMSRGPVLTALSHLLPRPNEGAGIYEREGWIVGANGVRSITLTRTSGPSEPITYPIETRGDDATFVAPASVTLPLKTPTSVSVVIKPTDSGIHSVLLNILDPNTATVVHSVLATIVAAETLDANNGFQVTRERDLARPGYVSHFFRVAPDTPVLDLAVQVQAGSVKVSVNEPTGQSADPTGPLYQSMEYLRAGSWRRAFERPAPGVWEVVVFNEEEMFSRDAGPSAPQHCRYAVTAKLLGAAMEGQVKATVRNRLAPFTGQVEGSSLGSEYAERSVFNRTVSRRIYEIMVPPGAEDLTVGISNSSHQSADLDVYLYDCRTARCVLKARGIGPASAELVSVNRPPAGIWRAAVDGFMIPFDGAQVDYADLVTHPQFGRIQVADAPSIRGTGTSWSASWVVKVGERPEQKHRRLIGVAEVRAQDVTAFRQAPTSTSGRLSVWSEIARWPVPLARLTFPVTPN